jgi:hypothetical protein
MVWYGMVWYDYWDRYLHPGPATVGNLSCCSMSFSISIFISILSLISSAPTFPPPTGVPGTEETKKEAVVKLAEFWKKRCGLYPQGADELLKLAWSTVAREAIIDTLINKSGLQLKLSADTKNIYCRVRAPIKLLEVQAHKEAYRSVPCVHSLQGHAVSVHTIAQCRGAVYCCFWHCLLEESRCHLSVCLSYIPRTY